MAEKKSEKMAFKVPKKIHEILDGLIEDGYYETKAEIVREAIKLLDQKVRADFPEKVSQKNREEKAKAETADVPA